jgi:hypothetical protein
MKRFCFLTVALVVLFASCGTSPVPKQYRNYSETITVPGLSALEISVKTILWVMERTRDNQSPFYSVVRSMTENMIAIEINSRSGSNDGLNKYNNGVSFTSQNEQCRLVMNYTDEKTFNKNYPVRWMETWKNLAKDYHAYITVPPVSQEEIDSLIAKGNASFERKAFSAAEKNYRQALKSEPLNVDTLIAYGLCVENLNPGSLEKYKINTDRLAGPDGYSWESINLDKAYDKDRQHLVMARGLYNIGLSIDPDNEKALFCVEYNKEKMTYIGNLRSQIDRDMKDMDKLNKEERDKKEAERLAILRQKQEEDWAKFSDDLERFTTSVAQYQQKHGGGHAGNQIQATGAESNASSGSGSSSKNNNYDIARARSSYDKDAKIVESAYKNIKESGDYSGQQRQTFQQAQATMKTTREEAARNGYTIDKSRWETEKLP